MKKLFLLQLLLRLYSLEAQPVKPTPLLKLAVDWNSFLSKQDLIWNRIPNDYFEGAFVGNGLLGAMSFKDDQDSNALRVEIGRTDVYDHRTAAASAYETSRLPIGQLLLKPKGLITAFNMRTDLWNAETRGQMITSKGSINFRLYAPSGEEFMVLELQSSGGEWPADVSFRPQKAQSARYIAKRAMGLELNVPYVQNPDWTISKEKEIEVVTQPLLMGDDYATAWTISQTSPSTQRIFITVANRWGKHLLPGSGSAADAISTIQAALKKNMAAVEKKHRSWWHNYYPASFVSLPDARMESFYWIQLYKLASASRPGLPVIDLLGPWFKPTSWPLLWMNLNVQLTYYTTGMTNHGDLEENLYQLLERHKDQLIANVPEAFRNDCAGIRNPVAYDNLYAPLFLSEDPKNDKELNIIVLPWLMQMYYLHNRRSMNDLQLKNQVYPLMRRAFALYARILYKGEDGKYHIPYTYSDEYGNAQETSLNIALAKWGLSTLIETATRLHIDEPDLPKWKLLLENMADYQTDSTGILIGKNTPLAKPHRHYSHLFGIFPLYNLNLEQDAAHLPLMRRSIQHFTALDGDNCMYKFSGAASLWAAIQEGDSALYWLHRSLALLPRFGKPPGPARIPTVTPNTFYSERENPTFESPIASSRTMLDLLLQDWGNTIRVFPAMPSSWSNASFYSLKTQGAFLVSALREKGSTRFIHVKSLAGARCKIATDMKGSVYIKGVPSWRMKRNGSVFEIQLKKGEEAILFTGTDQREFEINALGKKENSNNAWGLPE